MSSMKDQSVVAGNDVCWGVIGEKLVLFSTLERRLHILNETAASAWTLTDSPIRVSDLVRRLAAKYDEAVASIETDVLQAVEGFIGAGLCHVIDRSTPSPQRRKPKRTPVGSMPDPTASTLLGPYAAMGIPITMTVDDDLFRSEMARILAPLSIDSEGFWSTLLGGSGSVDSNAARSNADAMRLQHFEVSVEGRSVTAARNGVGIFQTHDRALAVRLLVAQLNSQPLSLIDDAVVLHAAAADVNGTLVVFPAVSGSGKSTLIAQLVERGHAYLTDEAVAIDVSTLRARPYHKSICIERGASEILSHLIDTTAGEGPWDIDPRTIGPGRLSNGGPVSALVFPKYDAQASPQFRPLEPIETIQELLGNTFDFTHLGQPAFSALVRIANALPAYELVYPGDSRHLLQVEDLVSRFVGMAAS